MSSEEQAENSVTRLPWPEQFKALAEQSKSPILKAYYESGCVSPETPLSEVPFVALDFETTTTPSLQRFLDWFERDEVEIVRDPSAPLDAVRAIAQRDRRIRIVERRGRRGLSSAVVEGMLASAAPVLALLRTDAHVLQLAALEPKYRAAHEQAQKRSQKEQDGSEIRSVELERLTAVNRGAAMTND